MKSSTKKLIIMIASALLLLIAIVFNFITLPSAVSFQKAQLIINIIACLFAIVYVVADFKKDAATFFKLFIGFLALKEACALINMGVYETITQWYAFALVLICFTSPMILVLRQDLGKVKSIILISIYSFVAILCLVTGIVIVPPSTPDGTAIAIYNGTRVLLAALLFVLILAKYNDKAERKTK